MSSDYFRSHVPWVAVALLVVWCTLEAMVFTVTVLHLLSRQRLADEQSRQRSTAPGSAPGRTRVEDFAGDLAWLQDRSDTVLGYVTLPVLHLIGAALDFPMVAVAGRLMLRVPFRGSTVATELRNPGLILRL